MKIERMPSVFDIKNSRYGRNELLIIIISRRKYFIESKIVTD
jgi:hypothetical protein